LAKKTREGISDSRESPASSANVGGYAKALSWPAPLLSANRKITLYLCHEQDARADMDMNLVVTGSKKIVEVQATAEHRPFDDAQLAKMMSLARSGIESLIVRQQAVLTGLPLRQ
jgi:ribonuclease PH